MDPPLEIAVLLTPPLETNTYVLRSGEAWALVDPGWLPAGALARLAPGRGVILLTHGHGDHIAGAADVKAACPGTPLICPAGDAAMLTDPMLNLSRPFGMDVDAPPADELIRPGEEVAVGESRWRVLDTSGHTPGGVSFYCEAAGVVICGDALFAGSIGRTDIPGADEGALLRNIREHLLRLPDDTRVLPGHGPETTIAREKRTNPFLR